MKRSHRTETLGKEKSNGRMVYEMMAKSEYADREEDDGDGGWALMSVPLVVSVALMRQAEAREGGGQNGGDVSSQTKMQLIAYLAEMTKHRSSRNTCATQPRNHRKRRTQRISDLKTLSL